MYIWNNNNYKIGVTVLSKNEKCKSLFYLIAVTLIFINPVSADFINGDFETGDLTGWDSYESYSIVTGHDSTYAVQVYSSGWNSAYVYQQVDLTDIDLLSFYFKAPSISFGTPGVYIDNYNIENRLWAAYVTDVWEYIEIDVSEYSGDHYFIFRASDGGGSTQVIFDDILLDSGATEFAINFNPDVNETNSSAWPSVDITLGLVPSWPYYHVKLYTYLWINESWGAKTLYTYKTTTYPKHWVYYFSVIEDGNYGWGGSFPLSSPTKKKFQVDLIYPGNNSVVATDSYIYDPDYVPPPPPPEEPPEDPPEPNATAEPTPGPDPEPPEEPPTGPGANQTLNVSWVAGYNDKVNNTVDYLFEPIYNFSYQMVYPVILLNTSLNNFSVTMNETLSNSSESIGISTTLLFIIMDSFPQKLINVMLYYFIWLIILMVFKGDM